MFNASANDVGAIITVSERARVFVYGSVVFRRRISSNNVGAGRTTRIYDVRFSLLLFLFETDKIVDARLSYLKL